eukprot:scaffold21761_cov21-Phaeocystis_antarctica.AAC.1
MRGRGEGLVLAEHEDGDEQHVQLVGPQRAGLVEGPQQREQHHVGVCACDAVVEEVSVAVQQQVEQQHARLAGQGSADGVVQLAERELVVAAAAALRIRGGVRAALVVTEGAQGLEELVGALVARASRRAAGEERRRQ